VGGWGWAHNNWGGEVLSDSLILAHSTNPRLLRFMPLQHTWLHDSGFRWYVGYHRRDWAIGYPNQVNKRVVRFVYFSGGRSMSGQRTITRGAWRKRQSGRFTQLAQEQQKGEWSRRSPGERPLAGSIIRNLLTPRLITPYFAKTASGRRWREGQRKKLYHPSDID